MQAWCDQCSQILHFNHVSLEVDTSESQFKQGTSFLLELSRGLFGNFNFFLTSFSRCSNLSSFIASFLASFFFLVFGISSWSSFYFAAVFFFCSCFVDSIFFCSSSILFNAFFSFFPFFPNFAFATSSLFSAFVLIWFFQTVPTTAS